MNALRQALVDYLAVRRILGYKLARLEKLLARHCQLNGVEVSFRSPLG
jgi:hypothetical protein